MKTYALTLVGLLALTGLTFGLSFVSLGAWQAPVAILIAVAKALLVALFFMHLAEQTAPARMAALIGVLIGLLLLVISVLDVTTRPDHELEGTRFPILTPAIPSSGGSAPPARSGQPPARSGQPPARSGQPPELDRPSP